MLGQKLQGHGSAQLCIFGRIDHAHSPGAKLLQYAIVRYGLAYHSRESYVREMGKSMKAMELGGAEKGY